MTQPIAQIKDVARHRAKCAARAKRYRENNRDKWAKISKQYRWKLKSEVIGYYGGQCACCGENALQFLAIDHIGGKGNADRIAKMGSVRGGTDFYRKLKQLGYPDGYRVLCHNCNQAIGFYGACPHAS